MVTSEVLTEVQDTPSNTGTRMPKGSISAKDLQFFTLLEKIWQEQKEQTKMLAAILEKLGGLDIDGGIPDDINFPLNDNTQLSCFEKLRGDKNLEKLVVGHLTSIGGSSIDNMGSRILKYVFANRLAEAYNWSGSKGKKAFGKLLIPSLLKRAIKRSYRGVTDAQVMNICRIFFKICKGQRWRQKEKNEALSGSYSASSSCCCSNRDHGSQFR